MQCQFCNILAKDRDKVIRETRYSFVILSNPRLMPGHLLVIPRRHVERFNELGKEEKTDLLDEVVTVQDKILEKLAPGCDIAEHYRPFVPGGPLKVTHLHIHIQPRFLDDELYTKSEIHKKQLYTVPRADEWEYYKKLLR